MSNRDYLEALFEIVDALNNKYPTGNTPFQIVARLTEEVGELAQAVNHCQQPHGESRGLVGVKPVSPC